jgi:hypothetical protein
MGGGKMNEERRQILEMLSSGKITTDEAERLLFALDEGKDAAPAGGAGSPRPKYLRVMVEDRSEGDSKTLVNVRVPMQLLRAGVKLAGLIPVHALDQVNEALHEKGMPVDLSQLKPENLEELVENLSDLTVDVDQDHAKVRVFCE